MSRVPSDAKNRSDAPASATPESARSGPGRVLIVEDEFLVGLEIESDIRAAGYATLGPYGALDAAMKAARAENFDLAVLDVNVNGESVFPLADELTVRKTPFVLLSGYLASDLPERYRNVPQIAKPYDPAALLKMVSQALPPPAGAGTSGE